MKTYDEVKQEATHEAEQVEKLREGINDLLKIWDTPESGMYDKGVVHGLSRAMNYVDLYFPVAKESEANHA